MKRRTFLQTICGVLVAPFLPHNKQKDGITVPWHQVKTSTEWTRDEILNTYNSEPFLIWVNPANQFPRSNTKLVFYEGRKQLIPGQFVYYKKYQDRIVTDHASNWDEATVGFAGLVKETPEKFKFLYPNAAESLKIHHIQRMELNSKEQS